MTKWVARIRESVLFGVLAVYLGVSWLVLQVVDILKQNFGLPDWVFPFAVVLLLLGLPIVLATAILQTRGDRTSPESGSGPVPSVERERHGGIGSAAAGSPFRAEVTGKEDGTSVVRHRLFTWRNALAGGGLAFLLLAVVTGGFMYMRTRGIGPVGSLVAKGVLEERSRVLLAEFDAADPALGRTVTESFRVDLAQSPMVVLVEPDSIADALDRMGRPRDTRLTEHVARELGVRDGIPAIVTGELASVGRGFVLTASLVASSDGAVLASARASAPDSGAVLDAIDEVSSKLRERIGESYTSLRASPPLAHVTTTSLDALRKYTEAQDARLVDQDDDAAVALLEEAVAIDSTFALAWRDLATILGNQHVSPDRRITAMENAYRYRDRLTERERYLVEASYYSEVTEDWPKSIQAYQAMLRLDPDDAQALNNIGFAYWQEADFENALIWYGRAHKKDPSAAIYAANVGAALTALGRSEEADSAFAALDDFPPSLTWDAWRAAARYDAGDEGAAREGFDRIRAEASGRPASAARATGALASLDLLHGRVADARAKLGAVQELWRDANDPSSAVGPDLAEAWMQLVVVGDTAGAVESVDALLADPELDSLPPLERPWNDVGRLLVQAGQLERGRALIQRWYDELPPRRRALEERWRGEDRAMIALEEGNPDRALSEARSLPPDPCRPCRARMTAEIFDRAGRPDSTIAWLEKAVETPAFYRLFFDGFALARTHERLGQLYDAKGDTENAALHYARFVELWKDADPVLQPRVRAAQDRLDAILKERG